MEVIEETGTEAGIVSAPSSGSDESDDRAAAPAGWPCGSALWGFVAEGVVADLLWPGDNHTRWSFDRGRKPHIKLRNIRHKLGQ